MQNSSLLDRDRRLSVFQNGLFTNEGLLEGAIRTAPLIWEEFDRIIEI